MNLLTLFFYKVLIFSNSTALDDIFKLITSLGSEVFYMMLIPPIFWCLNKKFGFRLLVITSFAAYIATVLKNIMKIPRPPAEHWKTEPDSYSFPSGHAYGSTTLWSYVMIYTRQKFFIILGMVIIVLVALSRVYLGVHYPSDVYVGVALGILTVLLFLLIEPKLTKLITAWSFEKKICIGTLVPAVLFIYGGLFFSYDPRGVKLAGALLGIFLGYILEEEYVKFSVNVSNKTKAIRIILGLFIAYLVYFGLNMVLPFNIITCLFTAWLGGFTVMFIAPWVFKKIES